MKKLIVGVMGPGASASEENKRLALELGERIAKEGWVLLTGGGIEGVMHAACEGAKRAGGLTLGISPGADPQGVSEFVDIPVLTGVGLARNTINVLTSDIVVALGAGSSLGTTSEVALALTQDKSVIMLNCGARCEEYFRELQSSKTIVAETPSHVIDVIKRLV